MSDVENRPSGQYRWRNNNVVWKTGMTRPPCNDGEHDCPNRRVGCRSGCEAWQAWEKLHAEEREALQKISWLSAGKGAGALPCRAIGNGGIVEWY